MPQLKSCCRLRHGSPAGLSIGKSADFSNASATQHSPKQLAAVGDEIEAAVHAGEPNTLER